MESIVHCQLTTAVAGRMNPLQFAYRAGRGVEDVTLTLLDTVSKHLDSTGNFVRILFMDFSSAFNTIQPHLLQQRLLDLQVNPTLVLWIRTLLCDRPQRVCVRIDPLSVPTGGGSFAECTVLSDGSVMSKELVLNTGAPQGCVLSPLQCTQMRSFVMMLLSNL